MCAGILYLHVMKISAVFPHSNGYCAEVILVVLHCVLHDLFLRFFSVYRNALCDTSLSEV